MLKSFLIISLISYSCCSLFAVDVNLLQKFAVNADDFSYYDSLNNTENRLSQFKDADSILIIKIAQLNYINESRKKHKKDPVKLDIFASRVANKMSKEAGTNEYIAHWNLEGLKPYHRYGLEGGLNHVSENTHGTWSTKDYEISLESIFDKMNAGHDNFMKERRPNDGHKQNIIDGNHNKVGIGCYIDNNQFRYYEEFLDVYVKFIDVEKTERGIKLHFTVEEGYYVYAAMVSTEKIKPKTVKQLKMSGSYFDQGDKISQTYRIDDLINNNDEYKLVFNTNKSGYYYIQVFISNKAPKPGNTVSTKGTFPATGVVIKI